MTIFVDKSDGNCAECSHSIHVETDFFNDGGIKYWPEAMLAFGEEE